MSFLLKYDILNEMSEIELKKEQGRKKASPQSLPVGRRKNDIKDVQAERIEDLRESLREGLWVSTAAVATARREMCAMVERF